MKFVFILLLENPQFTLKLTSIMNLWLSSHLLFAALFLSSSALTPEECQPLITPLSLVNSSVIHGKFKFLVGFTDHEAFKAVLKATDSGWLNIRESPTNTSEVIMSQENKINGTCLSSRANATIENNTITARLINVTSMVHVLPSCDSCLVLDINSTLKNSKDFLQVMRISDPTEANEIQARALYLFGSELTLKDSDLEHFKKQASCLGFSGELDFHFDAKKSFCEEGKGLNMFQ
ncbi:uncharacterized protein LOC121656919 [Melanotaenia boesemani]|uniref:uncharacterized protein LOC121656919 n=1 Tax=Melanotaenia boesemani TaxID=1250792 RepID=UPI001C056820|nr:uncharacterized protein LOC121656919 [Melanotaenia boesemani]